MNFSDEESGQFHQLIPAKDILKHIDLNDVPAKSKEEYDALRTEPYKEKNQARISAENKLIASRTEFTKKPGRYEGNSSGQGPSLHESIKSQGVQRPLDVGVNNGRMTLWNGHGRLSAQLDIDPEADVPVKFHEQN